MSTLQTVFAVTAAVAVGTAYVLVHEHRRKLKADRKKAGGAGGSGQAAGSGQAGGSLVITREQLIAILDESATAAFQLIEQVRWLRPSGPATQLGQPRVANPLDCCCPVPLQLWCSSGRRRQASAHARPRARSLSRL